MGIFNSSVYLYPANIIGTRKCIISFQTLIKLDYGRIISLLLALYFYHTNGILTIFFYAMSTFQYSFFFWNLKLFKVNFWIVWMAIWLVFLSKNHHLVPFWIWLQIVSHRQPLLFAWVIRILTICWDSVFLSFWILEAIGFRCMRKYFFWEFWGKNCVIFKERFFGEKNITKNKNQSSNWWDCITIRNLCCFACVLAAK